MTSGRPASYSAISSASRVEILHQLQTGPRRTIAELVAATGLHPNTVREHLQRLLEDGYVVTETEKRQTRGRPRVLYSAADGAATSSPVRRQKVRLSAERGDLLRRILPSDDDGLTPTERHQLDAVVDQLLDDGFDPIVDERELTIDLTPCTHVEAQAGHLDVLCTVHLGLIQGVMTEAGGPLAVGGMRPACDPRDCVIQLLRARPEAVPAD